MHKERRGALLKASLVDVGLVVREVKLGWEFTIAMRGSQELTFRRVQ